MKKPPGPKGLPLLGSVLSLRRGVINFLVELGSYGDISYAMMAGTHTYLINDPDLIELLLTDRQHNLVKDASTRAMSALTGRGLLTTEGEFWLRQRRLAAPTMQPKRITSYAGTMVDCAQRLLATFRDGEERDVHRDIANLTLEIVGRTLLGADTLRDAATIGRALDALLYYYDRQLRSWEGLVPARIPTPARRRLARARAELDQIIFRLIDGYRNGDGEADHLLARLLRTRDEDGKPMPDEQLRDQVVTMLLAGHETNALVLTYCLHMLAEHPAAADRLRAELDTLLRGRLPTAADTMQLPYLDAVVRETLRLYPPAFALGREVVESFELGGYQIPRGAQVVVSPYVTQRDPRFYRDPSLFKPERWLSPEIESLPRYAYVPFGGGPRICIGNHFAMLEASLVLAVFMSEVELQHVPGFRLETASSVTLRPRNGLHMRVRRRTTPQGARIAALAECPTAFSAEASQT
jgi:cytochrome P450